MLSSKHQFHIVISVTKLYLGNLFLSIGFNVCNIVTLEDLLLLHHFSIFHQFYIFKESRVVFFVIKLISGSFRFNYQFLILLLLKITILEILFFLLCLLIFLKIEMYLLKIPKFHADLKNKPL